MSNKHIAKAMTPFTEKAFKMSIFVTPYHRICLQNLQERIYVHVKDCS